MKSEKGIGLIEIVISIGILGIISVAIVGYFQWSFGVFGYTDRKATAESLARSQMESVKQEGYDNADADSDGDAIGQYEIIDHSSPYEIEMPPATVISSELQKITVIVKYPNYNDSSITDNLTLEGYKRKR